METSCVENRQCDLIEPEVSSESRGMLAASPAQPEYMGVVPLPHGSWGAQLYDGERRVWLGVFDVKAEAARAYDVAVQRFRGRGAVTNFEPLEAEELAFLCSRSEEEVVDMLRKQTYHDELKLVGNRGSAAEQRKPLFEKALMPSDVGELNRLVIPKHHAKRHLPLGEDGRGVVLSFEDECGKVWRFRYSYWKNIKAYVLTRRWNWFVKEKGLQGGDVVTFHRSVAGEEKRLFNSSSHARGAWRRRLPLALSGCLVLTSLVVQLAAPPPTLELGGRDRATIEVKARVTMQKPIDENSF